MSDIYQFNVGGTTYNLANLGLLAPVQITLTADRLYNTGDQFIYTGLLYEATETIAQGTSITIGSNAQLADCVTKQISEINSKLSRKLRNGLGTEFSTTSTTGEQVTLDFTNRLYFLALSNSPGNIYYGMTPIQYGMETRVCYNEGTPIMAIAKVVSGSTLSVKVTSGYKAYIAYLGTN